MAAPPACNASVAATVAASADASPHRIAAAAAVGGGGDVARAPVVEALGEDRRGVAQYGVVVEVLEVADREERDVRLVHRGERVGQDRRVAAEECEEAVPRQQ